MIIYKAINIMNYKGYIGLTDNLEFRKWTHFNDAKGNSDQVFHRAIRKYGEDAFTWEVLDECDTREEAGQLEIELIKKHNTFKAGYNATTGGEWGWTVSDETRKKMSIAQYKRAPRSAETCEKIRQANLGCTKSEAAKAKISAANKGNKYRVGKKHSEETKRKIRKSCKKNANPWNKGKRGVFKHTEETKQRLSEISTGRSHSKETRLKISESNRRRKCSETTKRKMSESAKRRWAKA